MITLREYDEKDWLKIDDAVEPFMIKESLNDFNKITQKGIAVTAIENDNVMACGGIAYMSDTEGIVWIKVSRKCLKHPFRWSRTIRETFEMMADSIDGLKISTYILDNFFKGKVLAKLIGMKRTNEAEKYNGNIYYKYKAVI